MKLIINLHTTNLTRQNKKENKPFYVMCGEGEKNAQWAQQKGENNSITMEIETNNFIQNVLLIMRFCEHHSLQSICVFVVIVDLFPVPSIIW